MYSPSIGTTTVHLVYPNKDYTLFIYPKSGSKEARKQRSKEAKKQRSKEAKKQRSKEAKKQRSKEARKQARKQGRKQGVRYLVGAGREVDVSKERLQIKQENCLNMLIGLVVIWDDGLSVPADVKWIQEKDLNC
ncbi:hypothetical protein CANARDRAFT_25842 [[Candida] arabinofermentans NRRL YB-2248]|uniref:Uncharacterized protein n=1 Tax=[Candida] arabinofermentans NRRL YB-2248 TaxID=983967 RepID=A0A1E4ST26_9ASCO|nr:hypothetical protein CANARDRAFT_25842 [[Candida] arabinofermentans NRRL YB-2248]